MDKATYKTLGDSIGMPDKEDRDNIRLIILKYEKKHPGEIESLIDFAKKNSPAGENKHGLVNKEGRRYLLELPKGLYEGIEQYIPTIFREKKHFAWFCKTFPELLIASKY